MGQKLTLASGCVRVHKNGIQFKCRQEFQPWTEMTVELESPQDSDRIHAHGIVVACAGSRHAGYTVSMVFTQLSPQSKARLDSLAAAGYSM